MMLLHLTHVWKQVDASFRHSFEKISSNTSVGKCWIVIIVDKTFLVVTLPTIHFVKDTLIFEFWMILGLSITFVISKYFHLCNTPLCKRFTLYSMQFPSLFSYFKAFIKFATFHVLLSQPINLPKCVYGVLCCSYDAKYGTKKIFRRIYS